MSENKNTLTTTPEAALPKSELREQLLDSLGVEAIENLRKIQRVAYTNEEKKAIARGLSEEEAKAEAEAAELSVNEYFIKDVIDQHGLEDENEDIDTLIKYYSYSQYPDEEWYAGEYDENGEETAPSGLKRYRQDVADITEAVIEQKVHTPEPVTPAETETTPEEETAPAETEETPVETEAEEVAEVAAVTETLDKAAYEQEHNIEKRREMVEKARQQLAALSAKRQGRWAGKGGEAYEKALADYNARVIDLGKHEAVLNGLNEKAEAERNKAVISYLFEEQAKLRDATIDALQKTKLSKVIKWMTEGSTKSRILKGLAVGAGGALVVGGLGAIIGLAGVGALTATATATTVGAFRFARGYAAWDARQGRGMDKRGKTSSQYEASQSIQQNADADVFESAQKHFNSTFEEDTKLEQKKRRRAGYVGLGAVAVGGLVGTAFYMGMDASNPELKLNQPHLPFETDVQAEPFTDHDPNTLFVEPTPEVAPAPDPNFYVEPGEGGISLFQDMGLTEAQWYEVQNELLNNFPNDFYMEPGEAVRIQNPGQLPIEVQQYIKTRFGLS